MEYLLAADAALKIVAILLYFYFYGGYVQRRDGNKIELEG